MDQYVLSPNFPHNRRCQGLISGLEQMLHCHDSLWSDLFLIYGFVSAAAMLVILFQSVSTFRHAFYESFPPPPSSGSCKRSRNSPSTAEIEALAPEALHLCPDLHLGHRAAHPTLANVLPRDQSCAIEALQGGACRVTFDIRGNWAKTPGSHVYAYIPTISL